MPFEFGTTAVWAPHVFLEDGTFHVFLTYMPRIVGKAGISGIALVGDWAFLFYFTPPGQANSLEPP